MRRLLLLAVSVPLASAAPIITSPSVYNTGILNVDLTEDLINPMGNHPNFRADPAVQPRRVEYAPSEAALEMAETLEEMKRADHVSVHDLAAFQLRLDAYSKTAQLESSLVKVMGDTLKTIANNQGQRRDLEAWSSGPEIASMPWVE